MKKLLLVLLALSVLFMVVAAFGADMSTVNGYVSDSKCGAKGAATTHTACAKKCIAGGEKPVFVVGEKTVYTVTNPDMLVPHAGEKITLDGDVKDGALTVKSISQ